MGTLGDGIRGCERREEMGGGGRGGGGSCLLYGIEFGQNEFLVMLYVRSSRFLQRQVM